MHHLDRRNFLRRSAAAGAGLGLLGSSAAIAAAPRIAPRRAGRLFDISLAQWSWHRRLRGKQEPALDNLDYAKAARAQGIGAIEYVNTFFRDKVRDEKYLTEMRTRAEGEGVRSLLIMCDGLGALGDPGEDKRAKAISNHEPWIGAAAFFGCHSIRVNARSRGSFDEQQKLAADGLRRLTELAAKSKINVIVENHGGLSSNGAWLAGVMRKVGHLRCGTLPDFGNFRLGGGKEYDRYQGVTELMPFAKAVSAKSHDFDENGNEIHTDYLRMMKIVLHAGYDGYVGIEYEGGKLSEDAGVAATKRLLERVHAELAS